MKAPNPPQWMLATSHTSSWPLQQWQHMTCPDAHCDRKHKKKSQDWIKQKNLTQIENKYMLYLPRKRVAGGVGGKPGSGATSHRPSHQSVAASLVPTAPRLARLCHEPTPHPQDLQLPVVAGLVSSWEQGLVPSPS
jgi:hypothetical protein